MTLTEIKNVIKADGTGKYFALYQLNRGQGLTLEIRTLKEPQQTLYQKDNISIWRMRELILELIHTDFVPKADKYYLTERADEIIFENYSQSTKLKWFGKDGEDRLNQLTERYLNNIKLTS
ncbi:hypothetical protein [Bacillus litorisediminis]|uniref:hypothetical protein n=1 Tax=Bacillus litorisediminis TaxID=2922713 RepID=UPI001FAF2B0D|nr:hypothetical protein [Bacillus litorisediminis]